MFLICETRFWSSSLLFLFFVVSGAVACEVPTEGPEYDAQIEVVAVGDQARLYEIRAPLSVDEKPLYKAYARYRPKRQFADIAREPDEIKLVESEGVFIAQLRTPDLSSYDLAEVVVIYDDPLGGCPIYAYTRIL